MKELNVDGLVFGHIGGQGLCSYKIGRNFDVM